MENMKKFEEFHYGIDSEMETGTGLETAPEEQAEHMATLMNFLGEVKDIRGNSRTDWDVEDMESSYRQLDSIFKKYVKFPEFQEYLVDIQGAE